ncbi:MAG: FHA domain-containing protein [Acidimicrobiales bacterium]
MVTVGRSAAFLVVHPGTNEERLIPLRDRLWVGRDCRGVDEEHRFELSDPSISREHFEIRLDLHQDRAYVFDTSTNGTRLNGSRVERAVPVPLKPGDRLRAGATEFEFRSVHFQGSGLDARQTTRNVSVARLAMVVGDVIAYSTISQHTQEGVLLESIDRLYGQLRGLLTLHRGTLNNYVGDAFFAIWELESMPDASEHALSFALDANDKVAEVAPSLAIRDPEGRPVQMGWGVALGQAAVSTLTGSLVSVLGDATNVAFRLSGLAGRNGLGDVLATKAVYDLTRDQFVFARSREVTVKGRTGTETIYEVDGRA